jgi:opacity protein-like surface antigen
MLLRLLLSGFCTLMLGFIGWSFASAQDERAQYPQLLSNSYIGLHVGYVDYGFSNSQLTSGFGAESIRVPHLAFRALLFGHEFNKYFSSQVSYLRPVEWVRYENVNADRSSHSVWMNVAGLTAKLHLPVNERLSVYGEGGLGFITRKGFEVNGTPAVKDVVYATMLSGAGVTYHLNSHWSLVAGTTFSPAHPLDAQPRTSFVSTGLNYTIRPLSAEQVENNSDAAFVFPKNTIQVGYITNAPGYGPNDFFSKGAVPIFFSADVQAALGGSLDYQRNVFHTRRVFSLDWGAGITSLKSRKNGEWFSAASLYPLFRFTLLRTRPADWYLDYSLAGPTFISRTIIDRNETGGHFTFQDFMGAGVFVDRRRSLNAEIRIMHYSNGNLFPHNPGVTVPLSFHVGYAF